MVYTARNHEMHCDGLLDSMLDNAWKAMRSNGTGDSDWANVHGAYTALSNWELIHTEACEASALRGWDVVEA